MSDLGAAHVPFAFKPTMELSVIIPAHNPRLDYLQSALDGLRAQTLPASRWELLVVDNRSEPPLAGRLELAWHPHAAVVREEQLGLTRARVAGFGRARGELVVLCDDDNVLAPDYLAQALKLAAEFPSLGTWSGHQEPVYEKSGFTLPEKLEHLVGGRRVPTAAWSNDLHHHASTPWGAGMCIRRVVMLAYVKRLNDDPRRRELDLIGGRRIYGGDTDIAFTGCEMGLGKGVFPQLKLRHLIAAHRCSEDYLVRVSEGHAYSATMHEYLLTGRVTPPRSDWRGRITSRVRRFFASPMERRMQDARRAGELAAVRELAK